jgi:hypothetical protein
MQLDQNMDRRGQTQYLTSHACSSMQICDTLPPIVPAMEVQGTMTTLKPHDKY